MPASHKATKFFLLTLFWSGWLCLGWSAAALARPESFYPQDGAYLKDTRPLFAWTGQAAALEISRNGYFNPPDYAFSIPAKGPSGPDWSGFKTPQALPEGQYFWRLKQGGDLSPVSAFYLDPAGGYLFLEESELEGLRQPYQAIEAGDKFHLIYLSDSTPQIYYLSSTDQGKNWSDPLNLSRSPYPCRQPRLLVVPEGIIAAWLTSEGSAAKIGLTYQLSGQSNWSAPLYFYPAGQQILDFFLAADPAPRDLPSQKMFLVYTAGSAADKKGIYLTTPIGHGEGWSPPRRLGQPDLACQQPKIFWQGDRVVLFWVALAASGSEEIYAAGSADEGLSWSRPVCLTGPATEAAAPLYQRIICYQVGQAAGQDYLVWEASAAFTDQSLLFLRSGPDPAATARLTLATKNDVLSQDLDLLSPPQQPAIWSDGREVLAVWQQIDTDLTDQIYLRTGRDRGRDLDWTPAQIISWPNFSGAGWPVFADSRRPYLIWMTAQAGRWAWNFIDLDDWPYRRSL